MKTKLCPECGGKFEASDYEPFCGERCKQIDLGKWIKEQHIIRGDDYSALDIEIGEQT